MKKNFNRSESFDKIHSDILDVLSLFLAETDYESVSKKCENCQRKGGVVGEMPECYGCILEDGETRKKLDAVIDTTPLKEVFVYQNRINNIANKTHIRKYKLLCAVLESAIYTKMI